MISKHVPYEAAHDNYGALARYIADASHEGEKCLAIWCAGCEPQDARHELPSDKSLFFIVKFTR